MRILPTLTTSIALAFCSLQAAHAADTVYNDNYYDTGTPKKPQWDGTYIGGQLGASSSKFPNPFSGKTGLQGGIVVGKTFQSGSFVYGGELEGNYGGAKHKFDGSSLKQTWSGAAKAKAGIALDSTLIYGTVGYGVSKLKADGDIVSGDGWKRGMIYGAGVEQAIAGPLSVKAEYNFSRLGNVKTEVNGVNERHSLKNHSVKLGLNYRF